ncbi:MAG: hypothetical protein GC160_21580 [Acidobacteria bacterium]|nr:hypothetical protein [Acidobacteriota bacterium]
MPRALLVVLVVALLLAAAAYWALRKRTPAEQLAALRQEVEPQGGVVFETELEGRPVAFLAMSCEVYLLDTSGRKVQRTRVLKTGFYLFPTVCLGQSIRFEDGYVLALLENRAIGAGGGNTSGGSYRSKDGSHWEKWTKQGWLPVEEAQA